MTAPDCIQCIPLLKKLQMPRWVRLIFIIPLLDVRSITKEETANLSRELYDAGEISLLDHAILSFDPDQNFPDCTGLPTQADRTGHLDLISEYEARIDMDKKMGNRQSLFRPVIAASQIVVKRRNRLLLHFFRMHSQNRTICFRVPRRDWR